MTRERKEEMTRDEGKIGDTRIDHKKGKSGIGEEKKGR